jgi:hypothetical protein
MKKRIGNKLVEVDTSSGKPVIKATAKEIRHPDGRVDVIIEVPCLQIAGNIKKGE